MEAEVEALKRFGVNLKPNHAAGYKYEANVSYDATTQIRPWEVVLPKQIGWPVDHVHQSATFEDWSNPGFLAEVRQGIAYLTFNEPENNNSFSPGVSNGLADACRILRGTREIRLAMLTGNGRMWSAGGDPRAFQSSQKLAGVIGAGGGGETPAPAKLEQRYEESRARPGSFPDPEESAPEHDSSEAQPAAQLEERYAEFGAKDASFDLYGGPYGPAIVYNEHIESGGKKNIRDAVMGASMFYVWATIPQFSIACMNGSAMGGALGLLAGSDFVVAVKGAFAVLSEVRLGVIPAVVSPHVIRAVGASNAKRIFSTAENMSAAKAMELGLVQRVVTKKDEFPAVVKEIAEKVQAVEPSALAAAKAAIFATLNQPMSEKLMCWVADEYARVRKTPECEAGMRALAEERSTPWDEKKIDVKETY